MARVCEWVTAARGPPFTRYLALIWRACPLARTSHPRCPRFSGSGHVTSIFRKFLSHGLIRIYQAGSASRRTGPSWKPGGIGWRARVIVGGEPAAVWSGSTYCRPLVKQQCPAALPRWDRGKPLTPSGKH
jgi:hypothetical protein